MITGGFGTTFDLERGTSRQWYMKRDGVKRWADTGQPVRVIKPTGTELTDCLEERKNEKLIERVVVKGNMFCRTESYAVVQELLGLGWKLKEAEDGQDCD